VHEKKEEEELAAGPWWMRARRGAAKARRAAALAAAHTGVVSHALCGLEAEEDEEHAEAEALLAPTAATSEPLGPELLGPEPAAAEAAAKAAAAEAAPDAEEEPAAAAACAAEAAPKALKRNTSLTELSASIKAFFGARAGAAAAATAASGPGTPAARSRRPTPSASFDAGDAARKLLSLKATAHKAAAEQPSAARASVLASAKRLRARVARVFSTAFKPATVVPAPTAAITVAAPVAAA
jgi:hypothetical protein